MTADQSADRSQASDRERRCDRDADRLLFSLARKGPGWAAVLAVTTIAAAIVELLLPAMLGQSVDAAIGGSDAIGQVAVYAGLVVVLVACDSLSELATGISVASSTARLRHALLGHVLALGPRATRRFPMGDVVSRLLGNAAEAGNAPAALVTGAVSVLVPVGGLVGLVLIDPWLAIAFLVGMPVIAVLLRVFVRDTSDIVARYMKTQGVIGARLVDALTGARTIAAAGTVDREAARVLSALPELSGHGRAMWHLQGRVGAQGALLGPLLQVGVLAVAGMRLASGDVSPGEMLAASQYAMLAAGVGPIVSSLNQLANARAGARRAAEVFAVSPPMHGTRRLPPGTGTIEFRGVSVRMGRNRVLDDLDIALPGGAAIAIVGRSGAGKSVLAALVGRLADPDEGQVLLDGVPVNHLERDVLRREVGYAFERPVLLGETLGDAIAFGAHVPPSQRVRAAARAACADDFIRRLPQRYDTPLVEAPMSGGEVQRVGLARAFAHAGRALVLDDATSSLDTVTEMQVGRALTSGFAHRTRLIVAHRAGTAARADLVLWLDGGRVRACMPHDKLWEDPHYRAVFQPLAHRSGTLTGSAAGGAA